MRPAPSNSISGSTWFDDEEEILRLARRSHAASRAPEIPGYEDLLELRRGGQGVVYSAVQRSTRRRVAIKVLLAGALAAPAQRRRFEREAELAASLRHPNIVRVFDSGVTPEGWHFLVMEFVEGHPLGEAPAAAGSDLRARIILFHKIAQAVAHAHQRGVIHRDLKPSNVRIDESGEPRVLDFGLAKSSLDSGHDQITQSGQFLGSLPWVSPEQTEGDPQAADVRSDVYSLGVMLYQALTGAMPYDTSGSLSTALQNIRTVQTAIPRTLQPQIGEDLAAIVLRCLAKEPARRYQSAADLAEDLHAWLDGRPIAARRDSAWYTLRTTARRYRRAAWVGAAFAAVFSAALVVSVRAARTASQERDLARDQADKANAVSDFVRDMLSRPDPSKDGREVKVADILAAAGAEAERSLAARPLSRAAVQNTLGFSYAKLGLFEESLARHRAAESAASTLGPESDELLSAQAGIATCLNELGKSEEALTIAQEVADIRHRVWGPTDPRTLDADTVLATCLDELGRSTQAEPIKQRIADEYRRLRGTDDPDSIMSLNNLAMCFHRQGKVQECTAALEQVLAAQRRLKGGDTPESVTTAVNLASSYKVQGRAADAAALLESAYAAAERIFGPEHTQTLVTANNYADLLMNQGDLARAEPILLHVLEIRRRVDGPHAERTLGVLSNVGTLYRNKGDDPAAGPYFQEAAEGALATLGPAHRTTLICRSNYAGWLGRAGRSEEAATIYAAVTADARAALGDGNWMVGAFELNYARTLSDLHRPAEAEEHARAAHAQLDRLLGPAHDRTTSAAELLATLCEASGDADQAAQWRARAAPRPEPK